MKLNFKKISILGLTAVFISSAVLCCCIIKTVHAKEHVPSCHQTSHEADSSDNLEECDCDQSFVIIEKSAVSNELSVKAELINIVQLNNVQIYHSPIIAVYQTSSQFNDSIPIFIKNSVLRI